MSIADNINHLRKQKKMTQKQLAAASGLAVITIQQYEAGKYEPKKDSLYKLCKALDCNINEILDKPFDLSTGIYIDANNLDELLKKYKDLTGCKLIQKNIKSDDYFEAFLCYLESLGYQITVYDLNEMKSSHIEPECDNDFYIGVQDNRHDNVTFFHKQDFLNFQKEVEKIVDYEIYKQYQKDSDQE